MNIDKGQIEGIMDQAECLYSKAEVEAVLDKLAKAINLTLAEQCPIVICVMNGGIVSMGKILTRLNFPLQVDYLQVSRYGDQTMGGELHWRVKPVLPLKDRVVLLIDDILDEGITLQAIVDYLQQQQAKKVYSCVLVEKQHNRKKNVSGADFVGLQVQDKYVFGYGMDYKGFLRNAAGIYAIKD